MTQNEVKKNYETSKKCDRVAQKSEITQKKMKLETMVSKKNEVRLRNVYIENDFDAINQNFDVGFIF